MKLRYSLVFALVLSSASIAQKHVSQTTGRRPPYNRSSEHTEEDWLREEAFRIRNQEAFLRAHSDETGKFRTDLWIRGLEQRNRMKVAKELGPISNDSTTKK